ncbi:unnamed protein product [Schistosoma spindalis]|nr:unnamed protein product [Schistosoma spindale]
MVNSRSFCGSPPSVKLKLALKAIEYWEETLTVKKPGDGKQLANRYCESDQYYTLSENKSIFCYQSSCKSVVMCGGVKIPDEYIRECYEVKNNLLHRTYINGSGIPAAGYILFVDSINTPICYGSTAAYASSCLMDGETDRPILGFVNVCPGKMKVDYPEDRNSLGVFLHEIGHALGFASHNFPFMRYPDGTPRTPRDDKGKPKYRDEYGNYIPSNETIKKITRAWRSTEGLFTKDFYSFVTPSILTAARTHFNCSQLDGADLENRYQTGPIESHWEGRAYSGEVMASRVSVDSSVSLVTLGFFEDSGWYTVNKSKAMRWEYGRKLGCDFCMKSCFDYAEIQRQYGRKFTPFCDTVNEARCRDAFSYGVCSIFRYEIPVPIKDRFFLKAPFDTQYGPEYFGGEDPFSDYCPTMAYVKGLGCEYSATSFCTHEENEKLSSKGVNRYYQTYGPEGICVEHRSVWTYTEKHTYTLETFLKGSCHKYTCYKDGTLGLYFKNSTVNCTRKDQLVHFNVTDGTSRLTGEILCPNINRFCKGKT